MAPKPPTNKSGQQISRQGLFEPQEAYFGAKMTTDQFPAGFAKKRPILRFAEKRFLAKNRFFLKKQSAKRMIFIWEKGTFSFA